MTDIALPELMDPDRGQVADEESHSSEPKWLPTPEEIAAECAKIRAGWTRADWKRAVTFRPIPWHVPVGVASPPYRRRPIEAASNHE